MQSKKLQKNNWNLEPLFKDDSDPEIDRELKLTEKKNYEFINKWKNHQNYLENPKILKKALDEYENLSRYYGVTGKAGYYFYLRLKQEQNNSELKARYNKIRHLGVKIENDITFFSLGVSRIKPELQKKFLKYKQLDNYKHYLKKKFEISKYLLSEPEEKILNLKETVSYDNWVNMVSSLLSKEERSIKLEKETKVKNFSEIINLLDNKNEKIRDSAAKAFNDILKKHIEIAEHELNSVLANKKIDDELRKIHRADFTRHLNDDIETEIVDTLINVVSERFDIPKRYYRLKSKLMKVKKLDYHERNVPYGNLHKRYTYEEGINLVYNVFKKLNKRFAEILLNFQKHGQIDVHPRKGKSSGGMCIHNLIPHPTYILLNYGEKIHDVLVIAHEFGHAINNELIKEKQNALNFGTSLATAEVASTFMEDFVFQELLKEADDELKLAIMMMKLNSDISGIFRQAACYKFEQELHIKYREKGYLSKKEIGDLFQKNMKSYMGNYVKQSEGSENWWVYWRHIREFFYNYSYTSGHLISKTLQNLIKKESNFIKKIEEFLSIGTSDSPKNIFKKLGVDITKKEFWETGIDEIEDLLVATEKLAKRLKKI